MPIWNFLLFICLTYAFLQINQRNMTYLKNQVYREKFMATGHDYTAGWWLNSPPGDLFMISSHELLKKY